MSKLTRRHFLSSSAALAAGAIVTPRLTPLHAREAGGGEFRSNWSRCPDRVWLGPGYWANPLQDWHIAGGRLECARPAPDRNVHVLVRQVAERTGSVYMTVRLGRVGGAPLNRGGGSAGFRLGIQGPLREYRNSLVFGQGLNAGITSDGTLFIGTPADPAAAKITPAGESVELRLTAEPAGASYSVTLAALAADGRELGKTTSSVPATRLVGSLALVSNFASAGGRGAPAPKGKKGGDAPAGSVGVFWFSDWSISGSKIDAHPERAFGPVLFSQYTLSRGIMKMTAQMPPIGRDDTQTVRLEVQRGSRWQRLGEERIHPDARTASFRVEKWNDREDVPYRLAYDLRFKDGQVEQHHWTGMVRRDPVDQPVLSVANISCNIHEAFPNVLYVGRMADLKPDFLAFTGDQFYEASGGFGFIREPAGLAMLDYLRKWYLHGWTWRELMRDRPSISLPDDHDVYQGNIWGESGEGRKTTQAAGGYDMPVEWVNMVHRTQTSHHPDPYDPTPVRRGTTQYYGPLTYGRVSFALLADRQYKSGPEGKVPGSPARGDHVTDVNFDPRVADLPGLHLLGDRQEQFLREWVTDWRGAEMKAVISQTLFTALPTTHGREPMVLRADYDSNGWPQTARNRALREIRKAFALHIAGDQHLPAVVQYGVDEHRDGPVAFAGPAVNVGYPRWWQPEKAKWSNPQQDGVIGNFTDSFGHPLTVLAVRNATMQPQPGDVLRFLNEKASGLGVVRFDKPSRRITIECWPLLPPAGGDAQFPGWPVHISVLDNYARKPAAHLPTLRITGVAAPLIQVVEERTGELVYALRVNKPAFRPHVFAPGRYTVRISDPDGRAATEIRSLEATPGNQASREVRLQNP